jgi:hypothetical protein
MCSGTVAGRWATCGANNTDNRVKAAAAGAIEAAVAALCAHRANADVQQYDCQALAHKCWTSSEARTRASRCAGAADAINAALSSFPTGAVAMRAHQALEEVTAA